MRSHDQQPARAGFTLRDVLIGCLCIGILVMLVEMQIQANRGTAGGAFCQTNQRQIGIALFMYAADYDGKLPISAGSFQGLVSSTSPYMRDDSRYRCPETANSPQLGTVGYRIPPLYAGKPIAGGWPDPYLNGQPADPNRTILLFESATDTGTQINPAYRHSGGAICLIMTGQTAWEQDLTPR